MRSERIAKIQRRAKRRVLALAIGATAVLGYGALSLVAQEPGLAKPPVSQMGKVPAVRSVGIRLVNSNAKVTKPSTPAPTQLASGTELHGLPTLPPPATQLPAPINHLPNNDSWAVPPGLPPSTLSVPALPSLPSLPATLPTTLSPANLESSAPILAPPVPNTLSEQETEQSSVETDGGDAGASRDSTGYSPELTPPPRMPEAYTKPQNPNGRVVVKLPKDEGKSVPDTKPSAPKASARTASVAKTVPQESVDIRVLPQLPSGKPVTIPSVVFADVPSASVDAESKSPVHISLGESGPVERLPSPVRDMTEAPKSRTPELVKPVPTQISHTVELAPSANLVPAPLNAAPIIGGNASALTGNSSPSAPLVEAKTNVAVRNEAARSEAVQDKSVTELPVANGAIGIGPASDTPKYLADTPKNPSKPKPMPMPAHGFVSLAPPPANVPITNGVNTVARQQDRRLASATKASNEQTVPVAVPIASATATIELECQSATAVDLHGLITAVVVENEDVCRVIHNDRTLSIVGNRPGSSLVQIWTEEMQEVPHVVRVNVSQPYQRPNTKPHDVNDVKKVLEQAFPKAKVNVVKGEDGVIEVRGTVDSEESARRMLEIVRKLCLVPVKDKVVVSR